MSTPPDQPNPYAPPNQPNQPPSGYGVPVPPQQNPYAQSSPYGPAAPPSFGPGAAVPAAPPAPGRGGAGRAVLWGVVGAVLASALWAGGVLLLRDSGTAPGPLDGYRLADNLCASTDLSAFDATYPGGTDDPSHSTVKGKAVDSMSCSETMKMTGSDYADAYFYVQYALHKKTDPGPEFTDEWLGYPQQSDSSYKVTAVDGYGDEAYLVTEDTVDSGDSGDRYVTLAVRQGWMTFSLNWSQYTSSLDTADEKDAVPAVDDAVGWIKKATTATLARLKSGSGTASGKA